MAGGIGKGTAIFAGAMEGVNKGVEMGLKFRHMQHMEKLAEQTRDYAKYRAINGAADDWMKRGGQTGPIEDAAPQSPSGVTVSPADMPAAATEPAPQTSIIPSALDLVD